MICDGFALKIARVFGVAAWVAAIPNRWTKRKISFIYCVLPTAVHDPHFRVCAWTLTKGGDTQHELEQRHIDSEELYANFHP